jgi:hypothetical protein
MSTIHDDETLDQRHARPDFVHHHLHFGWPFRRPFRQTNNGGGSNGGNTLVDYVEHDTSYGNFIWPEWFEHALSALLFLFLAGVGAVLIIALARWSDSWFDGNTSSSQPDRIVTIANFAKSRGLDVSGRVPANYRQLPNGGYAVTLLRHGNQQVNLPVLPPQRVVVVHGRFKHTTATLTYRYRPLYTVPRYQQIGDAYQTVRFNDPFGPHSGGQRVSEMIATLNEMPAGKIAGLNLRMVTIRTPAK